MLDALEPARSLEGQGDGLGRIRPHALGEALQRIAAGAAERDAAPHPAFPEAAFAALEEVGAASFNAFPGPARPPAADELELVRAVARADGSLGRIFDGHLNAVERVAVQAPAPLRERELAAFGAARLRGGVWGGDPVGDEGTPATVVRLPGGRTALRGIKTFCSGAGGLHRALVVARPPEESGRPLSVWVDLTDERRVHVDESWFVAHGLRASVSHRVEFRDAPVLAQLGPPGAIAADPWFSRDALRTASSWVGMADTAVEGALAELAARPQRGPLEALAAGRVLTAHRTLELWLAEAGRAMDSPAGLLATLSVQARLAIYDACQSLLQEAARACGSRPFARARALDRARRDLELFLLQHRLDPLLARTGEAELEART